ncbi:26S proteasome regulatory subunit 7 [Rhodotorula toruloides]
MLAVSRCFEAKRMEKLMAKLAEVADDRQKTRWADFGQEQEAAAEEQDDRCRNLEFSLPDNKDHVHILRIYTRSMAVERNIRFDLVARLCPNSTGADFRFVCAEADMFAIRRLLKIAMEKDFLDAVEKDIRSGQKFSSTSLYANYQ